MRSSLHQTLYKCLESVSTDRTNSRRFELTTLCTKPFRTHTLFPHALDPTVPIIKTDYLIILAETFKDYRLKQIETETETDTKEITVPVFALEASLYFIPTSSVQILYISKIDTTGLSPNPAPSSQLVIAFLSHFLENVNQSISSLRVHIFARAAREGHYLFPASCDNVPNGTGDGAKVTSSNSNLKRFGKRILNDQQLIKWWHQTLSQVVMKQSQSLDCFYILPGFDEAESSQVLPISKQIKSIWNYGHPYNRVKTPLYQQEEEDKVKLLSELIPAFNDDPKSRFLHSIGNSSTNPSGEPGDWDDAVVERSSITLESDRNRERNKINQISPDEFWDRMGGRQECCDGRVSAFFVLILNQTSKSSLDQDIPNRSKNQDHVFKPVIPISRNLWTSLWSKIHNKDYSKLDNASIGYMNWIQDVRSSIHSTILEDQLKKNKNLNKEETSKFNEGDFDHCHSIIIIEKNHTTSSSQNQSFISTKHSSNHDQIHLLQPRKKSKK